MKTLLFAFLATQLISCGGKSGGGGSSSRSTVLKPKSLPPTTEALSVEANQTYMANFSPLNVKAAGEVSGSATFHKEGDFLSAHVRVLGSAPNALHIQNVHSGTMCPTEAADTNLDGIIDFDEAKLFTEDVIIPLDGDINSQYSLSGMFPLADPWGAYVYTQVGSFARFWEDLGAEDEVANDEIVKPPLATFNLEGRVVMIQTEKMPVACGVLSRVWDVPGEFEPDDVSVGRTRVNPAPMGQRKPCVRGPDGKDCVRR